MNRDERGSMSLEFAVGVPGFLLLIALILFGGRVAMATNSVEAAAAEAARAASIERNPDQANAAALTAAQSTLASEGLKCSSTDVAVDASGFSAPLGTRSVVRIDVTCVVDLSDLSIPGLPGSKTVRAHAESPIDTWRQR